MLEQTLPINVEQNYTCSLILNDKGIHANSKNDKIPNIYMNAHLVSFIVH